MSTRATYQFISEWSGTHTAYIHHDGYPEGAANYLSNGEKPITSIDSFIRANEKAEMTSSHETHGDTDYRYTIEGGRLTVQGRAGKSPRFWSASSSARTSSQARYVASMDDDYQKGQYTEKFTTRWEGSVADFVADRGLLEQLGI